MLSRRAGPPLRRPIGVAVLTVALLALAAAATPVASTAQTAAPTDPCLGWTTRVVAEGLGVLENLEPDGTGGMLVSAYSRDAVERLLPDGTVDGVVAADMPAPGGLRVRDGILFATTGNGVADGALGTASGTIERIDLATGDRTTWSSGLTMPNGLVFDGDGNAYTSRDVGSDAHVTKVPADDPGNPDTTWADLPDTNGLAVSPDGSTLYASTTFNATASVYAIALDDPTDITEIAQLAVDVVPPNPTRGLDDLTIDADGVLYLTANGGGELLRLDPATGEACVLTRALTTPSAVTFGAGPGWPADRLYVTGFDGRVVEVIPPTAAGPDAPGTPDAPDAPAPPSTGADLPADFACPADSWVAGTTELCGGVATHRDYVFDDYGADLGGTGSTTGSLAVPAGDVRYPDAGPHNTADLVDLSLRIVGDRLEVLAELNALHDGAETVLALAIDTDDDPATGGGPWPGFGVASDGWDVLHTFDVGDPLSNMVGGHVPLPPGERWRVQAVTAQADGPAAGVESDHAVMNVAFRGPDEESRFTFLALSGPGEGAWFEDRQAAALADGDITAFGLAVNTADLRPGGARRTVEPVGPGLHERVYTSSVTLPPGEGMSYEGIDGRGTGGPTGAFGQVFHFHGRYQPYGLYLPAGPGPHGLGMIYHGSNQNHSQLVNLPGLQQQVAEDHGRILAAPLARGVHGYGADISERDLLDVRDDVLAAYDIDSARTIAAGYSQGGYVTLRQAALHPDHYAGLISWVGFTGDDTNPVPTDLVTAGAVGNAFDLVGNHLHIPAALLYGGADELIPVTSSAALAEQYRTLGSAFRFYLHPTGDHFQLALLDEWGKESAWLGDPTAATDPLHVRFRAAEVLGDVEVGVRHDTAHWVSQLRGRATVDDPFAAEEAYIDVDLRADGCGGTIPVLEATADAGPSPIPWVAEGAEPAGATDVAATAALQGTLANVASLVVDVEATCLAGAAVTYSLSTDGPTEVRLSDGRRIELASAGAHEGVVEAAAPTGRVTRLGGPDRVATAIAVSTASHQTAGTVVIARADDHADALVAGPLARLLDAPLLLTAGASLDDRVAAEVARLGALDVVVVGGAAAVQPAVVDALEAAGLAVDRVAGPSRFATAGAVARAVVAAGGDPAVAYLAEGLDDDPARGWPDAVAVAGLAARQGRPILLATTDDVPSPTLDALADLGTTIVHAVGGPAAISHRALAMAADPDGDGVGQVALHRITGADRFATSAAIADRTLDDLATTEQVWIVTGRDWPDALAAGPAAARAGAVLLLVDGPVPGGGPTAAGWLAANAPVEELTIVGGAAAVAGPGPSG